MYINAYFFIFYDIKIILLKAKIKNIHKTLKITTN